MKKEDCLKEIETIRKLEAPFGWERDDYRKLKLIKLDEQIKAEDNPALTYGCADCGRLLYKPSIVDKVTFGKYLCKGCSRKALAEGEYKRRLSYGELEAALLEEIALF